MAGSLEHYFIHLQHIEIAELRSECHELRQANASLERQIKEGLQVRHFLTFMLRQAPERCQKKNQNNGSRFGTGWNTPAPGSPQLRGKSPFLTPNSIPALAVPPSIYVPSPLSDNSLTAFPFGLRDIPGFYVVIPAGGAGTRLWPLSREGHPKFLLDLTLKGRSLIQATWDRLLPLSSAARTTIVAGPAHVSSITEQLPDLVSHNLFTEPSAKDSMAAIGLAAAVLARRDPEAIIGSFAADHMISGDDAFLAAVAEAVEVAKKGYLVTIGIAPSHPSTGFGYVRLGEKLNLDGAPNARLCGSFKEKPDARTAAAYIKTGNYRWNAGMFVTKATFLMQLLKEYKPELAEGLEKIGAAWDDEHLRAQVLEEVWPTLEKIAIDHAVAEPAALDRRVAVVPATFGRFSSDLNLPCRLLTPDFRLG